MMLNAVLAKTYHKTGNKKQAALHADTALSMLTRYRLKGEQKKLKRQLERIR